MPGEGETIIAGEAGPFVLEFLVNNKTLPLGFF